MEVSNANSGQPLATPSAATKSSSSTQFWFRQWCNRQLGFRVSGLLIIILLVFLASYSSEAKDGGGAGVGRSWLSNINSDNSKGEEANQHEDESALLRSRGRRNKLAGDPEEEEESGLSKLSKRRGSLLVGTRFGGKEVQKEGQTEVAEESEKSVPFSSFQSAAAGVESSGGGSRSTDSIGSQTLPLCEQDCAHPHCYVPPDKLGDLSTVTNPNLNGCKSLTVATADSWRQVSENITTSHDATTAGGGTSDSRAFYLTSASNHKPGDETVCFGQPSSSKPPELKFPFLGDGTKENRLHTLARYSVLEGSIFEDSSTPGVGDVMKSQEFKNQILLEGTTTDEEKGGNWKKNSPRPREDQSSPTTSLEDRIKAFKHYSARPFKKWYDWPTTCALPSSTPTSFIDRNATGGHDREGGFYRLKNVCMSAFGPLRGFKPSMQAYHGGDDVQVVTPKSISKFQRNVQSYVTNVLPMTRPASCYLKTKILLMPVTTRTENTGHVFHRLAALYDIKKRAFGSTGGLDGGDSPIPDEEIVTAYLFAEHQDIDIMKPKPTSFDNLGRGMFVIDKTSRAQPHTNSSGSKHQNRTTSLPSGSIASSVEVGAGERRDPGTWSYANFSLTAFPDYTTVVTQSHFGVTSNFDGVGREYRNRVFGGGFKPKDSRNPNGAWETRYPMDERIHAPLCFEEVVVYQTCTLDECRAARAPAGAAHGRPVSSSSFGPRRAMGAAVPRASASSTTATAPRNQHLPKNKEPESAGMVVAGMEKFVSGAFGGKPGKTSGGAAHGNPSRPIIPLFFRRSPKLLSQFIGRLRQCAGGILPSANKQQSSISPTTSGLVPSMLFPRRRGKPNATDPVVLYSVRNRMRTFSLNQQIIGVLRRVVLFGGKDEVTSSGNKNQEPINTGRGSGTLLVHEMSSDNMVTWVRLYTEVDLVVGTYGAGLFFSIFSPPHSITVELNAQVKACVLKSGFDSPEYQWCDYPGNLQAVNSHHYVQAVKPAGINRQWGLMEIAPVLLEETVRNSLVMMSEQDKHFQPPLLSPNFPSSLVPSISTTADGNISFLAAASVSTLVTDLPRWQLDDNYQGPSFPSLERHPTHLAPPLDKEFEEDPTGRWLKEYVRNSLAYFPEGEEGSYPKNLSTSPGRIMHRFRRTVMSYSTELEEIVSEAGKDGNSAASPSSGKKVTVREKSAVDLFKVLRELRTVPWRTAQGASLLILVPVSRAAIKEFEAEQKGIKGQTGSSNSREGLNCDQQGFIVVTEEILQLAFTIFGYIPTLRSIQVAAVPADDDHSAPRKGLPPVLQPCIDESGAPTTTTTISSSTSSLSISKNSFKRLTRVDPETDFLQRVSRCQVDSTPQFSSPSSPHSLPFCGRADVILLTSPGVSEEARRRLKSQFLMKYGQQQKSHSEQTEEVNQETLINSKQGQNIDVELPRKGKGNTIRMQPNARAGGGSVEGGSSRKIVAQRSPAQKKGSGIDPNANQGRGGLVVLR